MAYYALYLDESGKVLKNDYTSLCGYVAPLHEWERFGMEWESLRFKWQVPPIHMGQIMSPNPKDIHWQKKQKEWGDLWEKMRDDMLTAFADAIGSANIVCVGSVVDAGAYRKIKQEPGCILHYQDSNVFCLQNAVMRAIDKIETIDDHPSMAILLDDDQGSAFEHYSSIANLKTMIDNPNVPSELRERLARIKKVVHSLAFCDDKYYPALQAADMISYEARRFKVEQMTNPELQPSHIYAMLTHGGMNQPYFYPENILNKVARNTAKAVNEA
jgi:hypothetical protein